MKTSRLMIMAALAVLPMMAFSSCNRDDDPDYSKLYPNALVTVRLSEDPTFYIQLDDETALLPVNMTKAPYEKEVRALINMTRADMPEGADKERFSGAVTINWIDSILTKKPVANLGDENDQAYGNDPIEVYKSWMTVVEDGYITLHFFTDFGNQSIRHAINLVTGVNPENPYEVELRHNAFGDCGVRRGDGLVAFSLDELPDTEGETVKLTLRWTSFSGTKSAVFDYCTRKD